MTRFFLKPTKFGKRTTQNLVMKQNFKVIIRKKQEEWLKFKALDFPWEREREQNLITQKRSATDDFTK